MSKVPEIEFDDVITVNPSHCDGKYEVRVLRKWRVVDESSVGIVGTTEMVLIDKHGHKIQATIPSDLLSKFDDQVIEGRVYRISSLTINHNFGRLLATYHRYKFEFNHKTEVDPSPNCFVPTYGLSLISADSILRKKERYSYLVDVVGVVTSVVHDKNFYSDGRVTQSVTFHLNDQRRAFPCELSGSIVDEFRNALKKSTEGLPILVLQFAKLNVSQGSILIESVEGVTRMFVDPSVADVVNFRNGLVHYLSRGIDYTGLFRTSRSAPMSYNMEFLNDYPVRTMAELKNNPELGVFVVNARICEIVNFDPWWFPVCKCPRIFGNYIGAFHCLKCHITKFVASPKVRLTFEVDDETGYGLFRAFDHVMLNVAALNCAFQGISAESFYQAFDEILGKSIMFIVRKTSHEPDFIESAIEVVRASDHPAIIRYYAARGFYKTPSKVVKKVVPNAGKHLNVVNVGPSTTTTNALLEKYILAAYGKNGKRDGASTSGSKRPRV